MLPKEAILEYQAMYKRIFGQDISYADALEKGTELIKLFQVVYKPIRKEWIKATDEQLEEPKGVIIHDQ